MVIKRKISYNKYIGAVLIAIFFVIAGVFIGNYIAENKSNELLISQKAVSALLELSKLKEECNITKNINYCNLSWGDIWKEKIATGQILDALETRLGKDNAKVLEQKTIYNEVQYNTLELVDKVNQECHYNWSIILFFYTNDKGDKMGDSKLSEIQGGVLDTLYNMDANVRIFSFDIGVDGTAVQNLLERYNITYVPSLVINEKAYQRFMTRDEIQRAL